MRIIHVISNIDPRAGGTAAALLGLVESQKQAGLDVSVLSTYAEGTHPSKDRLVAAGVDLRLIGPCHGPLMRHPDLIKTVAEVLPQAQVVHIHTLWEEIQHRAARFCRTRGIPYLITPHGMLDPWSLSQSRLKKQIYLLWRLRRNLQHAARLHFTAETEQALVVPMRLRPPAIIEPNGLDLKEFSDLPHKGSFRSKYPALGDSPIVLFLSRLHYKKGLELLIPAFARAKLPPQTMLVLAGPDSDGYQAKLQELARSMKVEERVLFTGMLHGRERIEALVDADLFVLPSYQENFGIAVVEALACDCPVLISDQVNICREIQEAGVGGVVTTQIDPLTEGLERWMGDDSLRAKAKEHARKFVWDHYDWNKIARNWVGYYQHIIEQDG